MLRRRARLLVATAVATLTAAVSHAKAPPPLLADSAIVAADHPIASAVGVDIIRAGGNVVDAAIATALALGVVNPASSGLGGGGFLIYWRAGGKRAVVIDFRETAPKAARGDMFVKDGRPIERLSTAGPLAVAIPGEVAGLALAHARHGKLAWPDVVAPAEKLARGGFAVGWYLAAATERLASGPRAKDLPADLRREVLRPDSEPYRMGERLARKDLAESLALIAKDGPDAFYKGAIAEAIVRAMGSTGLINREDLATYRPTVRDAITGNYRGFRVVAMPPPSSGGVVLVETLGMLERHDLRALGHNSSAYLHLLAQALKFGFADRANLLGDVDAKDAAWQRLVAPTHAEKLNGAFDPARSTPHPDWPLPARPPIPDDKGTSHISVLDADGNAVALTTTINTPFGSKVVAPGTGIILNNEMDDFSMQPGVPNEYGLIGGKANEIAPGKRPLSSMSPTILVKDGKAVLVAGASGGPRIISATLQAILNVVDFGMDTAEALAAPRAHHQWVPDVLAIEAGIARDVEAALAARGHRVEPQAYFGEAQMALSTATLFPGGRFKLMGASDPRKAGAPAGF